ncbi:MAG: RelA/SpoT family protein [Bacteroidales bacterium]|nr:RelA/SpoT family protein [Bacteroidales bacterium]MBP5765086.1 RelA/SpoT family protein [Bacteroidales bacterium]
MKTTLQKEKETEKTTSPLTPEEEAFIQREFQGLLDDYAHTRKGDKADRIRQVFEFARKAHGNDRRKNGEPYICHPLAVARIVAQEVGMGSTSISAALLHDVVKDTSVTFEEIKDTFGERISNLVRGLTKISGSNFRFVTDETSDERHRAIKNPDEQAENFRNLLLTMSEDVRVIIVKIADRLHNMRTLSALPPLKQKRIANETLYLYAPLAYRLGLYNIKTELEDLSLKYENPEEYEELSQKLKDSQANRDRLFKTFSAPIIGLLDGLGLKYTLKMRLKSIYSIWNKMQKKHVPFEEVYDLYAARIVFQPQTPASEKTDCWRIYTAITSIYKLHPDRIRDWISHPKGNGYEALHVTVMGPDGNWIEIQIRSERMDNIAERGLAMHWKYKRGEQANEINKELDKWVKDIKDILDDPNPNALDFLDTIKLNLLSSEIYVFTPAGDLKELPKGATALDFAFALHTEVGFHAEAARVNHELVPLSTKLDSGQQVEIITSDTEKCQVSWAAFVTTSKARNKVRSYLMKHFPKEMADIAAQLEKEQKTSKTQQLLGWLHLTKTKKPKPKPRNEAFKPKVSSTTLQLSGIDGRGLLNTITKVIADNCSANITNIQLNCHDGLFDGSITLDTNDNKAISLLCSELKKIHEIEKAARQ